MAMLLGATSCSGFLTEDPKGQLTPETFFSTQDEINMGVYALFRKAIEVQVNTNMIIPKASGDDVSANAGSNKQAYAQYDTFQQDADNKGPLNCWRYYYALVKACNGILNAEERIKASASSPAEANIALGNAYFFRAYAYFSLVRNFGPLPLNLSNETDNYDTELSSTKAVYEVIVSDLKNAESMLPTKYTGVPRNIDGCDVYITSQAAKATLAAVYMAMGGYPMNQTSYYSEAAKKAKEVLEGKYGFDLNQEYKDVYSMGNNYNKEIVWGLSYYNGCNWATDSEWTSSNQFESIGGWGDWWGNIRFWKEFPEGPRKDATFDPQIRLADGTLVNWWDERVPERHPMLSVYSTNWDPATKTNINAPYDYRLPGSQNMGNGHVHRMIRFSEVKLWYAEACGRSGQAPDDALVALNDVRKRAGLEPYGKLSPSELAEAAFKEHGWEICGYVTALVTRRDDLFRMGESAMKAVFDERVADVAIEVAPGVFVKETERAGAVAPGTAWSKDRMYSPYPSADASLNKNLTRANANAVDGI